MENLNDYKKFGGRRNDELRCLVEDSAWNPDIGMGDDDDDALEADNDNNRVDLNLVAGNDNQNAAIAGVASLPAARPQPPPEVNMDTETSKLLHEQVKALQEELAARDEANFELKATIAATYAETEHQIKQVKEEANQEKQQLEHELRMARHEAHRAQASQKQQQQQQQQQPHWTATRSLSSVPTKAQQEEQQKQQLLHQNQQSVFAALNPASRYNMSIQEATKIHGQRLARIVIESAHTKLSSTQICEWSNVKSESEMMWYLVRDVVHELQRNDGSAQALRLLHYALTWSRTGRSELRAAIKKAYYAKKKTEGKSPTPDSPNRKRKLSSSARRIRISQDNNKNDNINNDHGNVNDGEEGDDDDDSNGSEEPMIPGELEDSLRNALWIPGEPSVPTNKKFTSGQLDLILQMIHNLITIGMTSHNDPVCWKSSNLCLIIISDLEPQTSNLWWQIFCDDYDLLSLVEKQMIQVVQKPRVEFIKRQPRPRRPSIAVSRASVVQQQRQTHANRRVPIHAAAPKPPSSTSEGGIKNPDNIGSQKPPTPNPDSKSAAAAAKPMDTESDDGDDPKAPPQLPTSSTDQPSGGNEDEDCNPNMYEVATSVLQVFQHVLTVSTVDKYNRSLVATERIQKWFKMSLNEPGSGFRLASILMDIIEWELGPTSWIDADKCLLYMDCFQMLQTLAIDPDWLRTRIRPSIESSSVSPTAIELAIDHLHYMVIMDGRIDRQQSVNVIRDEDEEREQKLSIPGNKINGAIKARWGAAVEVLVRFLHHVLLFTQYHRQQLQQLGRQQSDITFRSLILDRHDYYTSACANLMASPRTNEDIQNMIRIQLEDLAMDEEEHEEMVLERDHPSAPPHVLF